MGEEVWATSPQDTLKTSLCAIRLFPTARMSWTRPRYRQPETVARSRKKVVYDGQVLFGGETAMTDTVVDWVAHHAKTTPRKVATIDLASGRRHDYAAMHDRVGRIAGFLRSAGSLIQTALQSSSSWPGR